MAVWRALVRTAGWAARLLALVAFVLGLVPTLAAASVSISTPENAAANSVSAALAQDGPYKVFLPFVNSSRDDVAMAESNLQVIAVSAGYAHNCAIRPGGEVICWGLNDKGQSTPIPGSYTQISAGGNTTCGMQSDGDLVCWGDNASGQAAVPPGTYTQVSVGSLHTCAIKTDGTLACWGSNALGQLNGIPSGAFTQVAAGNLHTCAIRTDGTLACWGSNNYGQADAPAGVFTQVSAGGFHSCALAADGSLQCWGFGDSGQTTVPAGSYSAAAAGYLHTCALRADSTIACWGSDGYTQVSNIPSGEFKQISTSNNHTCAIRTGGTLACWGWNRYGQSFPPSGVEVSVGDAHACALLPDGLLNCWGDNTFGQSTPPAGAFLHVSAGSKHTCGIDLEGKLACWGDDSAGQRAAPAGTFIDVSAGGLHTCGLDASGAPVCWGDNSAGQLVAPAGPFTRLDAGRQHTCALNSAGKISCWGDNTYGQSTPPATGTFTQVSAGGQHSCALNTLGQVVCWGDNASGQGAAPSGTFSQVSAGLAHTCAISALGDVKCWGDSTYGQTNAPVGVFVQVSAGARTSCAVQLNGEVTCWGNDTQIPQIVISPATLPDAAENEAYSQALTASGGKAPYTFSIIAGALPSGLTLTAEGLLSGMPDTSGSYTFTVQATDSSDPIFTGQRAYTLLVTAAPPTDTTPPVIKPHISGTLGKNGWYISAVTVTWEVSDPESEITASTGCEESKLTADTQGQTLTCTATSAGGTSSESVTVKIDQTAPVDVQGMPDRAPDQGGWYNHPLTVTFTGQDATSGIASCTAATYSGPDSAAASVSGTCSDNAGNTSPAAVFSFQYDATAPLLNPVVQPNPVYLHGTAEVIPNASDPGAGLAAVTCDPLDTSSVGQKTVECRATDKAGNTVTAKAGYNVIYRFVGFKPPVENPPLINRAVAGQTIPFKFVLLDANYKPVTKGVTFTLRVEPFDCWDNAALEDIDQLYNELDCLGLIHDGNGLYHYNWKTSREYAGQYVKVIIDLGEGAGYEHVAYFWFRK